MLERLDRLNGAPGESALDFSEFDDDATVRSQEPEPPAAGIRRVLKEYAPMPSNEDSLELNALFARDEFGLDQVDAEILLLLLRYERNSDLEQFADEVLHRLHGPSGAVAALLGIDRREHADGLGPTAPSSTAAFSV